MESELANLSVKLEDAQERVKSVQWLVQVDLCHATEVSFLCLSLTLDLSLVVSACLLLIFVGSTGDVMP